MWIKQRERTSHRNSGAVSKSERLLNPNSELSFLMGTVRGQQDVRITVPGQENTVGKMRP